MKTLVKYATGKNCRRKIISFSNGECKRRQDWGNNKKKANR
jgi:hypothetical protein